MRQAKTLLSILMILMLLVTIGGCKKKQAEITPEPTAVEPPPPPPPPPPTREPKPDFPTQPAEPEPTREEILSDLTRKLTTIYFAFDSSELSETARRTLQANASLLKANPSVGVVVEGHCDERGTIEYNLALGERRASSVRDYLTSLGVDRSRMRVITYGEERPVDPGHNEAAWSKNRRAEFVAE